MKTQKAIKRDAHFGLAANPADAHDLSLSPYMGDGTGVLFGSFSASSSEEKGHHEKTLSKGAPFARFKTQKAIKRDAHFGSAANPADAHDLSLSIYGRWNGCPS